MPQITQAFVLGAGLGLRLQPLTAQVPKPLVPIFQKPLITFSLDHLRSIGIESFVINTHRLPEQFESSFPGGTYAGLPLRLASPSNTVISRILSAYQGRFPVISAANAEKPSAFSSQHKPLTPD